MAAVCEDDDGDFDDESLIRWRRHKTRAQSGARGTRPSTGSTRMTTAGRRKERRRTTTSLSSHTTNLHTNVQSSNQHEVTTPPTASTIVELDPMCNGVVMECSSGCSGTGQPQDRAGGGQCECRETGECSQQDMRCGEAVDESECTRSGEIEASCGTPEDDYAPLNEIETRLSDKSEDMELLSGAFESPGEDHLLAVDGVCDITSTAVMSGIHQQTFSSNSCSATEQLVGSLQKQPFTSAPRDSSEFNSMLNRSAKRRRRDSVPLARDRWRRRSPAGRRASSMTLHSSGQTSLLQFATTVHKSVSDSLQARRQNRATYSGPSLATAGPQYRSKEQWSAVNGEQVVAVSGATISHQGPCLPSQELSSSVNTIGATSHSASVHVSGRVSGCKVPVVGTGSGGAVGRGKDKVSRGGKRQCPFYKRVPETGMVVDAFSYGSIPDCPAYFLSHFHSDHYMGLSRRFQHPIYCSQVTANLVHHVLKVPHSSLHPLPLHTPCLVEGVEVILIDANHCPGSVMFLFRTPSGKNYLHTGDFRLCPAMTSNPYLKNLTIHQLFLDTTYCSPQYSFPTQQEVIAFAIKTAKEAVRRYPNTVVISGTYTIGKEKVFLALAEALGSKICVSKEKESILGCLQWPSLQSLLTTDPLSASVHVQPMNKLNVADLSSYLDSLRPTFSHVLAFSPTGWSHSSTRASLSTVRPKTRGAVSVYGQCASRDQTCLSIAIPYSEHSSFAELKHCVQQLKPRRVIPTVGNQSAQKRKEMERYFELWRTAMPSTSQTKQTSIDSVFECARQS